MNKEIQKELSDIESKIFLNTETIRIISDLAMKAGNEEDYCYNCIFDIFKEKSEQILEHCEQIDKIIFKNF